MTRPRTFNHAEIIKLSNRGWTGKRIAEKLGCSESVVYYVRRKKGWRKL